MGRWMLDSLSNEATEDLEAGIPNRPAQAAAVQHLIQRESSEQASSDCHNGQTAKDNRCIGSAFIDSHRGLPFGSIDLLIFFDH
jgi:hypothetical protein